MLLSWLQWRVVNLVHKMPVKIQASLDKSNIRFRLPDRQSGSQWPNSIPLPLPSTAVAQSNCPEKAAPIAPRKSPGSTQASNGPNFREPRILSIDEEALDTENGNLQGTPTWPAMPKTDASSTVRQESPVMILIIRSTDTGKFAPPP